MQRVRSGLLLPVWFLAAILAVLLSFGAAAQAATTSPSPSPGAGSSSTASQPPTVTFGLGPSNGKTLDGRTSFSYEASDGSVINDHIALVNISAQPLTLLLYATDATDATGGTLAYQPLAAKHVGASLWLALPEVNGSAEIRVKARSQLILPFQVRVPANASPGDHTAGIAVGLVADVEGKSTKNLKFEQRVVAEVSVRVSGTAVAKLDVEKLTAHYRNSWNPFGRGSVVLDYLVRNTGNVNLGAAQIVKLSGLFGSSGTVPKLPKIAVLLPGDSAKFAVHIGGVWPEVVLTGSVKVTPAGIPNTVVPPLHSVSASTRVWAIPWALIILIVIIVALAYALRRYLRTRAATRRAPSHSRSRKDPKADQNGTDHE